MNNNKKVLDFIFRYPEKEFHIREIARCCGLSPNTVSTIVDEYCKRGVFLKQRKANLIEVKSNIDEEEYKIEKNLSNLRLIHESKLINYLNTFYNNPKAIILFGSYLRGEDISSSDIDIAVITSNKKRPNIEKFEKKLYRKINIHPILVKEVSKEFWNNLINGYVLRGYLIK